MYKKINICTYSQLKHIIIKWLFIMAIYLKKYITMIYLGIFTILNTFLMLLYHLRTTISFVIWSIKWLFSLGGFAAIFSATGGISILVGAVIASYSIFQQYFYAFLTLEPNFKSFLDLMKAVLSLVTGFLEAVEAIISALSYITLGYFCILLFAMFYVVIPVLSALGWGSLFYIFILFIVTISHRKIYCYYFILDQQ